MHTLVPVIRFVRVRRRQARLEEVGLHQLVALCDRAVAVGRGRRPQIGVRGERRLVDTDHFILDELVYAFLDVTGEEHEATSVLLIQVRLDAVPVGGDTNLECRPQPKKAERIDHGDGHHLSVESRVQNGDTILVELNRNAAWLSPYSAGLPAFCTLTTNLGAPLGADARDESGRRRLGDGRDCHGMPVPLLVS